VTRGAQGEGRTDGCEEGAAEGRGPGSKEPNAVLGPDSAPPRPAPSPSSFLRSSYPGRAGCLACAPLLRPFTPAAAFTA